MPRIRKGARLSLQKGKGRTPRWIIRDGQRIVGTGCLEDELEAAEGKLSEYLADKHDPKKSLGNGDANSIKVADALNVYLTEKIAKAARPKAGASMISNLNEFFGDKTIGEVNGTLQRAYVEKRGSLSAARRELETMSAAINYHIRDVVGGTNMVFRPVLPEASEPRLRWLTRSEAARLLWAAWRQRELRNGKACGRYVSKHVTRFILVGLYTGSRAGDICGAALMPTIGKGYVDVETGDFRRKPHEKRESNKRQPTVPLAPRLLAHIRRWKRLGIASRAVVEWNGAPVIRISKAWPGVVEEAKLDSDVKAEKVIPHTLRHTAISWYLRAGVPIDRVSDYCGVSEAIIRKVYKHHLPGNFDAVIGAANGFGRTSGR